MKTVPRLRDLARTGRDAGLRMAAIADHARMPSTPRARRVGQRERVLPSTGPNMTGHALAVRSR